MPRVDRAPLEGVDQRIVLCRDILDDEPEVFLVKDLHHLVQACFDRFVDEFPVDELLDFQRQVAQDHRQREILDRTRPGMCLAPLALGVRTLLEHPVESLFGDGGIPGVARGDGQLREGHRGEGIRENVVGVDQRPAVAREREIPVVIAVMAVFLQELRTLQSTLEPLGAFFHLVIKHREKPHFTALQPDELVGVVDAAVAFEAGEIPPVLFILGVFEPKRQDAVQQLRLILAGQFLKIHSVDC